MIDLDLFLTFANISCVLSYCKKQNTAALGDSGHVQFVRCVCHAGLSFHIFIFKYVLGGVFTS